MNAAANELPTYVLERTFDAPRDLVWRTFTEADLLARWYGPNIETVIHQLDVTPGGLWLVEMKMGERSGYQRIEYSEVKPPERLVWLQSNADADWNIAPNPMMADWPLTLLTTVTFAEENAKTNMRLTWVPHEASEAEIACFAAAVQGLDKGWAAGMAILEAMLAELQVE
ncbi:MAG: SRPBCC domain-containing protein [Pseudomonadota bacterium]